jgi:mono/diheme cytochrome c family protein
MGLVRALCLTVFMEEQAMKRVFSMVLISIALLAFVTACGGGSSDQAVEEEAVVDNEHADDGEHVEDGQTGDMGQMDNMGEMDDSGEMDHMHGEAPDEFASLTNPFAGDPDAIAAGEEIFQTNCIPCHGPEGAGDGVAAAGLDPKPANLSDSEMMPMMTDGYLFWRVSKGGAMEPFNSAMVAWEESLSETQRWQVISFVRTLSE